MDSIRAIFMGSPEFAVPSLAALADSENVCVTLVVTPPDRKAGRGRALSPPAVKLAAEDLGIPVFQPESLRSAASLERLSVERPDLVVVVSYGEILRRDVLELPRFGCLNVHPSLLPSYRGSTPIPATILNGDQFTGVSIMRLVRQMDAGPIIDQVEIRLDGTETTGTLTRHLAEVAASRLPDVVTAWASDLIVPREQAHHEATYTRELRKSDAQIDWRASAESIERFIRAMDPWPRAWTTDGTQRITITRAKLVESPVEDSGAPGTLTLHEGAIRISTGDGLLELEEVHPAGKQRMDAASWFRGMRNGPPVAFASPQDDPEPLIFRRIERP